MFVAGHCDGFRNLLEMELALMIIGVVAVSMNP